VLDSTFLEGANARKRRLHEPSAQEKGILPAYRWTSSAIETAVPTAKSRNTPPLPQTGPRWARAGRAPICEPPQGSSSAVERHPEAIIAAVRKA
jgi:hypothetical protein